MSKKWIAVILGIMCFMLMLWSIVLASGIIKGVGLATAKKLVKKFGEETIEVINKLKEKYRVVIGSTADTYPLLKNMEDNNLSVHKVYTSEIIKTYKPDKKFYKYILENEKIDASEAIFIGDSLLDDVYGPSQLNITTILIDRKNNIVINDIKPDYVIHNLSELLDISF